jgi:hypothetical protein
MQKKFDVCRRYLQAHASDACKPMQAMPASPCKRRLQAHASDACMNVQMIPLRTERELLYFLKLGASGRVRGGQSCRNRENLNVQPDCEYIF